jgi:hypothetical protein
MFPRTAALLSTLPLTLAACDNDPSAITTTDEVSCDTTSPPIRATPQVDTTYTSWDTTRCLQSKTALCAEPAPELLGGLLRCEPVQGGWFWAFGESSFRVHGRFDDTCRVEWLLDVEGGAKALMCDIPLQLTPWAGLSQASGGEVFDNPLLGIAEHCTEVTQCSLLSGADTECRDLDPEPPHCELFERSL